VTFFKASPALERALTEHNYTEATPVQAAVLAPEAEGRDILVSAQTGSGKTVAYGLAIAPKLLGDAERLPHASAPLALVIAPTRELALQVERELSWLYGHAGARVLSCVGGMDARQERRKLAEGAHIIVGTPGRLRDHIEHRGFATDQLASVVLDEADEMLDLGFREDLEFILDATPETRQTLLFSATMPKGIAGLAKRYQNDALRIEVGKKDSGHTDIEYRAIRVAPNEHEHVVVNLLRLVEAQTAIVFCNTRESVRHLHATLLERGFLAVLLSGELSQHERNQSMQALRDGRARVCIATDVAARGIDLPNLGLVIHAELPTDAETLQHRSGRTGRAGRKGISALLVPAARRRRVEHLLAEASVRPIWSGPPSADDIRKLDHERLLQNQLLTEPQPEEDLELGKLLLQTCTPEQIAAALAAFYRARLPAIEDVTDPGFERDRGSERHKGSERHNGSERHKGSDRFGAGERQAGATPAPSYKGAKKGAGKNAGFSGEAAWFRLNIGRSKNADPKWLLPMLCRKGNISKQDIGAIRIFENETKFEVTGELAEQFAVNMRRPDKENIRIERLTNGPGETGPEAARPNKPKNKNKAKTKAQPKAAPAHAKL